MSTEQKKTSSDLTTQKKSQRRERLTDSTFKIPRREIAPIVLTDVKAETAKLRKAADADRDASAETVEPAKKTSSAKTLHTTRKQPKPRAATLPAAIKNKKSMCVIVAVAVLLCVSLLAQTAYALTSAPKAQEVSKQARVAEFSDEAIQISVARADIAAYIAMLPAAFEEAGDYATDEDRQAFEDIKQSYENATTLDELNACLASSSSLQETLAAEIVQKAADEQAAAEAAEAARAAAEEAAKASHSDIAGVEWGNSREVFVAEWAPRIDSYLSGSPLSGMGEAFANAAWDYGVDPRWSPAISCIESSKGAVCFRSHNAWGWGSSSWGSWEEAIDAHVSGLARGYGSSPSLAAAQKYCPPSASSWYSKVVSEMNRI